MRLTLLALSVLLASATSSIAAQQLPSAPHEAPTTQEQEILQLSRDKWRWMAEKKADTLAALLHDDAGFVHHQDVGDSASVRPT